MVVALLGVKTRCAEKSTAEHYEHTYIHGTVFMSIVMQNGRAQERKSK